LTGQIFRAWGWHLVVCLLAAFLAAPAHAAATFPIFQQVKATWHSSETRLLDRHGELLQEYRRDLNRRQTDWTALDDVSPALIAAVLRAEDKRFFDHAGIDWLAAGKAALGNWLNEKPRGASTLTMQLAALLDARYRAQAGRRDLSEKWRQMQAAKQLELVWSKSEILEAYLNLAPFRGELSGIDAAARALFDKRPAGLSGPESLLLAALIRAPNAKPVEVAKRVCALADDLPGFPDCAALKTLTLNTLSGRYPIMEAANLAPHLARRLLGEPSPVARSGPGRDIHTTLDGNLQRHVRETLDRQLAHLAGREVNDAAALVLDNASGEVLAYVSASGRDSGSPESDGIRASRQAGSTLKPFLYGLALERRLLTTASPLEDSPLSYATAGGQYAPENYDHVHRGLVSVRVALAGSLNIPAVRTLKLVGLEPFAARLARFGFSGLIEDADYYGYAIALGSLDVTLEELTNAYRALANGGVLTPLRFTPAARKPAGRRAQSREASFLIGDILSDRQARATTFGLENPLATRFWTAVKTGTSKDMRDNWCIGYSARYTVGVWIGNFSGTAMHDVSGISGAAPAWAAIMQRLHAALPSPPPPPPKGLVLARFASPSEPPRQEWFLAGSEPAGGRWLAAAPPAEIVDPDDGAILALDPDLPTERQRLTPRARHAPPGAWWQVDDSRLQTADWPLVRGRHAIVLKDAAGRVLDQASFEVR